ncbi:MAG: hypothetical protein ACI9HK_002690 [Pirellulaceae bacterium]|jgi:hypothetical protein
MWFRRYSNAGTFGQNDSSKARCSVGANWVGQLRGANINESEIMIRVSCNVQLTNICRASFLFALLLFVAIAPVAAQQATTVQLPTFGISVDAEGVVSRITVAAENGLLRAQRIRAAQAALPRELGKATELRKISLARLERALQQRVNGGQEPTETMQHLAGLLRIQYVFVYPNDIVLAGPAEGWFVDPVGRPIGITSGRPVIELRDLAVALRAFSPNSRVRPFIGCTIDPTREGLEKLQQFQKSIPRSIPQNSRQQAAQQIGEGIQKALGNANVRVFGISPDTHFAQVMIEADYRMKLIGIGLEPPPVRMATFMGSLRSANEATLQRWWFTPNYECLSVAPDGLAIELIGQGVQLQGEDKAVLPGGTLSMQPLPASKPSQLYTTAFTAKYPEIAAASPVYAQLRNLIDSLVIAAAMRELDLYGKSGWQPSWLLEEKKLPTQTEKNPRHVPAAVNVEWKGNRLLAPAGGGISIVPHQALEKANLQPVDAKLNSTRKQTSSPADAETWWWD